MILQFSKVQRNNFPRIWSRECNSWFSYAIVEEGGDKRIFTGNDSFQTLKKFHHRMMFVFQFHPPCNNMVPTSALTAFDQVLPDRLHIISKYFVIHFVCHGFYSKCLYQYIKISCLSGSIFKLTQQGFFGRLLVFRMLFLWMLTQHMYAIPVQFLRPVSNSHSVLVSSKSTSISIQTFSALNFVFTKLSIISFPGIF